jgi:hypothetical protein
MQTKLLCSLSFAIGLLAMFSIEVIAKNKLAEPYGDNIFCWYSDVPYNAQTNNVAQALTKVFGTGGIKVNTVLTGGSKFTLGHYEVGIDGSGISSAGFSPATVDHDFNAAVSTAYFVSKTATCTLPSALNVPGKEVLVWNACPRAGTISYGTSAQQMISGKPPAALSNSTPYRLNRFMSDGNNWYEE